MSAGGSNLSDRGTSAGHSSAAAWYTKDQAKKHNQNITHSSAAAWYTEDQAKKHNQNITHKPASPVASHPAQQIAHAEMHAPPVVERWAHICTLLGYPPLDWNWCLCVCVSVCVCLGGGGGREGGRAAKM